MSSYPPHFQLLPRRLQVIWMHHALKGPLPGRAKDLQDDLGGGAQHFPAAIRVLCEHGYLVRTQQERTQQERTPRHSAAAHRRKAPGNLPINEAEEPSGGYRICLPQEYGNVRPLGSASFEHTSAERER